MNKTAIICAGHGGGDPGAVGQGTTEAGTCIDITNRLADLIRADGRFGVHIVPHELGLVASINYVNSKFGNMNDGYALEIHKNSTVNAHGVEVWYYSGDSDSANFAQQIQNGLVSVTKLPNRGIKGDGTNRWGSLGWIRQTNTWAGLAECGFISDGGDPIDPDLYARGLYQGFLNLFGLPQKVVQPPTPTPAPPTASWKWKVTNLDGKQIGVYNVEKNAWAKYDAVQGSARIYEASGKDVTGEFVAKYRVVVVPPAPEPVEKVTAKDLEQDEKINALTQALNAIKAFLSSIFSGFKG